VPWSTETGYQPPNDTAIIACALRIFNATWPFVVSQRQSRSAMPQILSVLLCLATAGYGLCSVSGQRLHARGTVPKLPTDPNTTKYCSYWLDNTDSNLKCEQTPGRWGISMSDFLRWVSDFFYLAVSTEQTSAWRWRMVNRAKCAVSLEPISRAKLQQLYYRALVLCRNGR